jgi:hypothetical protein
MGFANFPKYIEEMLPTPTPPHDKLLSQWAFVKQILGHNVLSIKEQ